MNVLEQYRTKKGLTYDELAERLNTTTPNAWRWCRLGIKCPKSIVAISKLLKMKEAAVFKLMIEKEEEK